jgi:tetratricopeptide (TPR) repeat protein
MILPVTGRHNHCTAPICRLKHPILLLLAATASLACAWQDQPGNPALRRELTHLIESGATEQAVARAQAALRRNPDDPSVRHEYVTLHLALARDWLSQRRLDDCLAAVGAVLAVEPGHSEALEIQAEVVAARERAACQTPEIDRLLRLELFESALERIGEVKALRPDLAKSLAGRERVGWRGAADDHYFAGNFHEAFALYEHLRSLSEKESQEISARWLMALALALSQQDPSHPLDRDACQRLRERARAVGSEADQPLAGYAIDGLLAEQAGQQRAAGRSYAAGLGIAWEVPPADESNAAVVKLRQQVMQRLNALYDADRVRPRDGAWAIVLPDVWKQRRTEHFDVYARNDLVAERVAEAAEFHLSGLCDWLGIPATEAWEPRCELRVHATAPDLHEATETVGVTRALTEMRVQGESVRLRKTNLCQDDPWLLSSALPHELTHILLADAYRGGALPLAINEGPERPRPHRIVDHDPASGGSINLLC